jgi:putative SOS response-associated peptidase YedK
MCGRYSFAIEDELIKERFGVAVRSAIYKARYNCAPSQNLAVISSEDPGILSIYRWGLIPSWAKEPSVGNRLINARGESILEKPSFRNAFQKRRCLVLSDGFYEWGKSKEKVPHRIHLKNKEAFAMAGIWEKWVDSNMEIIHTFSIITTEANSLITPLHDRMPVILNKTDEQHWISTVEGEELVGLLKPYPADEMSMYMVSKKVNSPGNDSAVLWMPEEIGSLFP